MIPWRARGGTTQPPATAPTIVKRPTLVPLACNNEHPKGILGADGVTVQSRHANFQVDPRLATLLGETCRSSEQALKELVDNAWDADAPDVWITLPDAMTLDPITVRDDGTGLTERGLRQEYLKVARDRRASKGERTPGKHRLVKGRKGIGKFAGLIDAEIMK